MALLMSYTHPRLLRKGEVLLREGEECNAFYFVEQGHLRTWYNKDGIPINLAFTFEGQFTTSIKNYRERRVSEVNIVAGEDTLVWVMAIRGRFPDNMGLVALVRRTAIRMLLAAEEHSGLFKIYTPTERYRYIEEHRPELLRRIPLSQLASYLGIARETLSRIRAKH